MYNFKFNTDPEVLSQRNLKMILRMSDNLYTVSMHIKPSCDNRPT